MVSAPRSLWPYCRRRRCCCSSCFTARPAHGSRCTRRPWPSCRVQLVAQQLPAARQLHRQQLQRRRARRRRRTEGDLGVLDRHLAGVVPLGEVQPGLGADLQAGQSRAAACQRWPSCAPLRAAAAAPVLGASSAARAACGAARRGGASWAAERSPARLLRLLLLLTAVNRMPATPAMARRACTSSACTYLRAAGGAGRQRRLALRAAVPVWEPSTRRSAAGAACQRPCSAPAHCCAAGAGDGSRPRRCSAPLEGLGLLAEVQGVEAVVAGQAAAGGRPSDQRAQRGGCATAQVMHPARALLPGAKADAAAGCTPRFAGCIFRRAALPKRAPRLRARQLRGTDGCPTAQARRRWPAAGAGTQCGGQRVAAYVPFRWAGASLPGNHRGRSAAAALTCVEGTPVVSARAERRANVCESAGAQVPGAGARRG